MRSKKNDYSSSIQGSLFSRPVKKYSQPNSVLNSHRYNDASGFSSQVGIDMQNAVHGRASLNQNSPPDIDQMREDASSLRRKKNQSEIIETKSPLRKP